MKFYRASALIIALLCTLQAFGQGSTEYDVVTLKSGAVYKGHISEYVPGESLTIVLLDGRTKTFEDAGIDKISEAGNRIFELKKKGFHHESKFGPQIGNTQNGLSTSFLFNMVNGYKCKRSTYGIGTGIETYLQDLYIPLYADYTYSFTEKTFTPYVGGIFGYVFNPDDEDYYYNQNYKEGYTAGVEAGIRNYFTRNFGISFSVGYRYYHLSSDPQEIPLLNGSTYPVLRQAALHRINIKLGFLLN